MNPPLAPSIPSTRLLKSLLATGLVFSLLGLAACSKQEETPGQKLDEAIEKSQQAASEAVSAMQEMASDAARTASDTLSNAPLNTEAITQEVQAAKDKLRQAQDEARDAAATIRQGASDAAAAVSRAASGAAAVVDEAMSDIAISTRIRTDFARDSELSAIAIGVETTDGVVTLSGQVPTAAACTRAENLAKTAKGVQSVNNELSVQSQ